jgi:type IV pilus assembly protein PilY1
MKRSTIRSLALATTAAAAAFCVAPSSYADDTELFVGDAVGAAPSRPNILFILDTSGSMTANVLTQVEWDPAVTYGSCNPNRIYWSTNATPPSCSSNQWVSTTAFTCQAAQSRLASAGFAAPGSSGVGRSARWRDRGGTNNDLWNTLAGGDNSSFVECQSDFGVHGQTAADSRRWPGNRTNGPWASGTSGAIAWNSTGGNYYFFSANYVDWWANRTVTRTRLQIMQSTMASVLDSLADNVNVGLMRYSNDTGQNNDQAAQGGMVRVAMGPIESNRSAMKSAINSWDAEGWTPLSETLYEATQYFRGENVVWGLTSKQETSQSPGAVPSVMASRDPSNPSRYKSPMTADCQKNYIVFLTDGLPTQDNQSNTAIQNLPGFATINGSATCSIESGLQYNNSGRCTDDLAKWLKESDLRPDRPGVQNVTSYWIGFGEDVKEGTAFLQRVAQRGGGEYYEAADTAELTAAFTDIITRILAQTTTFTSPTVAVNAFNRTQNLNFLYMSVFKPTSSYRWLGNIKKYRITPAGVILDENGNAAVDPNTGFFYDGAQSYWSTVVDGADAELGGTASRIPEPATRKIYSNLTTGSGTLSENLSDLKTPANLALANQLLLDETSAVAVTGRPAISDLVDWMYGADVFDKDGDSNVTEKRADMGDPLHSRPATVIYGGPADDPDITLYATTNDGVLQAINAKTGQEIWAFAPRELLARIEKLYENDDVTAREYGLDGAVRVVRLDRNGNGTIEPSGTDINGNGTIEATERDAVYLFFGMRRGGSRYFGLDVTSRSAPKLLWSIGPAELPGVGQSWSSPVPAQVNVNRSWGSNADKLVLVFGGGYDPAQDTIAYSADGVGNRVFMIDALTGSLIWRAGPTDDTGAQLNLAKMTNAIPGDVRILDLSGDGFADRMYAADLGGRVWRFDVRNGEPAASLVVGGVFASLGVGDSASKPAAANRRFFYAPDVSLIKSGTTNWINVAIGSGHRELPITDQTTVNRFYSLRDYNIFTEVASNQYKASCGASEPSPCHQIITDDDTRLVDVTSDLTPTLQPGGVGWKMNLQDVGEKVLAESRTFQGKVYFTTYSPQQRSYNPEYCVATVGLNRLYVVDAVTGAPVFNFDATTPGATDVSDRSKELAQGSIAPEVIFVFPTPDADASNPNPPAVPPICLIGLESCGTGLTNPPVRTYWQQRGTN